MTLGNMRANGVRTLGVWLRRMAMSLSMPRIG
jgi:hypothetical protein